MVKCVRIKPRNAEDVRNELNDRDVIHRGFKISSDSEHVYIPVSKDIDNYTVVEFDCDERRNYKSIEEILGYKPSYEWIGDVVVLNKESELKRIVNAFKKSQHNPNAILNKETKIKGDMRIPEYNLVYGDNSETIHTEYGYSYKLDLRSAYFTPRLSTERRRFMQSIGNKDRTFDMFSGVGPYTVPAADIGESAVGTDINSRAIEYLEENAEKNGVSDSVKAINCDVRKITDEYENWADNVVMNLPNTANNYISYAERLISDSGKIYYYDFISNEKSGEEVASKVESKLSEHNDIVEYKFRRIRPYSPQSDNICLEFKI